jgi:hypothetical protein
MEWLLAALLGHSAFAVGTALPFPIAVIAQLKGDGHDAAPLLRPGE